MKNAIEIPQELKAENLKKRYKTRLVVNDVSLNVRPGEIVGMLGPNGAGKTTSFYMFVGLIKPDGGKIFLNGTDISNYKIHERARMGIGYLPQESSVFRHMTVKENLLAVLELKNNMTQTDRINKTNELLHEFHLEHVEETIGMSLSGGERRRVEIARAFAMNPKFLLLDEPFAGIDPISIVDLKRLIIFLKDNGIGILITDHNVREALDICQRAYIISNGEIICSGTTNEILQNKQVREVYLGEEFKL